MIEIENKRIPSTAVEEQESIESPKHSPFVQALIAIACLGFFPLVYILGRWLTQWLGI